MMQDKSVLFDYDNCSGIARITLNRPRSLNAINMDLLADLIRILQETQSAGAKSCVITGAGSSFCSGEDLKETLAPRSQGTDLEELRVALSQLQEVTRIMTCSPVIFIASVQGWAVGGGAELALAADLVIAAESAIFRFPEIIHAHAPTGGITARLPQLVGTQLAKKIMLLGGDVPAQDALAYRIATEVTTDPLARSLELAGTLSTRSRLSLSSIKLGIERAAFPNQETLLSEELNRASECFAASESSKAYENFRNRKSAGSRSASSERLPTSEFARSSAENNETLLSYLDRVTQERGSHTFLRFSDADTTYSQFFDDVRHIAGGLRSAGVASGDVVAALMQNSSMMVSLWFATMWVGAVWSPFHGDIRGLSLRHALDLVKPTLLIVDDVFMERLPADLRCRLVVNGGETKAQLHVSALYSTESTKLAVTSPSTTASLLFTSGTTGLSKACELSHSYFVGAARALIGTLRLRSDDVLFCPFPLCHADATSFTVISALVLGATAALTVRFSASRWWDEVRRARATVADFMGATLSVLYKAPVTSSDADNPLRLMWGVPVPTWVEKFEERFGLKIYEVYGSTETGLPVVQPIDRPRITGSCGVPLPGVELRIVDEHENVLPNGAVGELLVRQVSHIRFTGYYEDPEATARCLKDSWIHTGDLCRVDDDANLYFVGRKKHSIRRRGENVSAFEVEEALLLHPDVIECAAYGVPSELTEEDIKVSAVRRPQSSLIENDVYEFAVATMPRFHIPRYIEFVDSLPRTPTGKVEIHKLKDQWNEETRHALKDFAARE